MEIDIQQVLEYAQVNIFKFFWYQTILECNLDNDMKPECYTCDPYDVTSCTECSDALNFNEILIGPEFHCSK